MHQHQHGSSRRRGRGLVGCMTAVLTGTNILSHHGGVAGMATLTSGSTSPPQIMISGHASGSLRATELVSKAMKIRQSRLLNEELLQRSLSRNHPNLFMTDDTLLQDLFQSKVSELVEAAGEEDSSDDLGGNMVDRVKQMNIAPLSKRHLDVPDAELHLQMEAARKRAKPQTAAENFVHNASSAAACALIETVASDADTTSAEKYAMRVIPIQLPGPVAKAVAKEVEASSTWQVDESKSSVISTLTTSRKNKKKTLSAEEELRLVNLIHEGAKVKAIKAELEQKSGQLVSFKEWASHAMMTEKELHSLVAGYGEAKSTLVIANMGLVHSVVRNLYRSSRDTSLSVDREMDLIQEGFMGLIRAAELFDPSKGVRFSTYATIWIKGVLSHSHNHQIITIPSREKARWSKLSKAMKEFETENPGQTMSLKALAQQCEMTVGQVQNTLDKMPIARNMLSLDVQYSAMSRSGAAQSANNDVGLYGDKAFEDDADLAEVIQMKTDVVASLARNLDCREARLMRLRYGLNDGNVRTITECAEAMGISKQRASQLAKGCLKKLREADDALSLQEYLLTVA